MILIRPTVSDDLQRLRELHKKQGFNYELPDDFVIGESVEIDGELNRAALCRKTAELYYLLDTDKRLSRKDEIGMLVAMRKEISAPLKRVGITDLHCWVPPEIDARFGKLLLHLGWRKPLWTCYHLESV